LDHAREPTADELAAVDRMRPVAHRLGDVLERIPLAVARKGLPFSFFQTQLKGRKRGSRGCDISELSRALYARGWFRYRHYERIHYGPGVTLWYPPGVDPVREVVSNRPKMKTGRPPRWLVYARQRALEENIPL
jgi:hypothetical protein